MKAALQLPDILPIFFRIYFNFKNNFNKLKQILELSSILNPFHKFMAVLNYISAISSPISQDSSSSPRPDPRQTKVILPNKKPEKWSTGVSPGEYGGPPTTTKLRKYWGGEKDDPLTSHDYIWNREFMGRMKKLIKDQPHDDLYVPANKAKVKPSGFLSLNRVMTLDSLEVDLSKELMAPPMPQSKELVGEKIQIDTHKSPKWRLAPTRREQEKWDRASKAATGGSDVMFRELRRPKGDPEVLASLSREQYFKLKNKMQNLTLAIGGIGLVSAYVSYSPQVAASFGAGLIGSLAYIRMLGSSVDSLADGAKGLVKGAVAQPRLLVPVILVMVYNRWNGILVEDYGVMELQLIPMLVGFFTYKVATFAQALEEALTIAKNESQD